MCIVPNQNNLPIIWFGDATYLYGGNLECHVDMTLDTSAISCQKCAKRRGLVFSKIHGSCGAGVDGISQRWREIKL